MVFKPGDREIGEVIEMENEEAQKTLANIEEALFKAKVALMNVAERDKTIESLRKTVTETNYLQCNSLLRAYKEKYGNVFEICPECQGAGGFEWDNGEGDCGGEPCNKCESMGYVFNRDKQKVVL